MKHVDGQPDLYDISSLSYEMRLADGHIKTVQYSSCEGGVKFLRLRQHRGQIITRVTVALFCLTPSLPSVLHIPDIIIQGGSVKCSARARVAT
jgi:hypothetical protein